MIRTTRNVTYSVILLALVSALRAPHAVMMRAVIRAAVIRAFVPYSGPHFAALMRSPYRTNDVLEDVKPHGAHECAGWPLTSLSCAALNCVSKVWFLSHPIVSAKQPTKRVGLPKRPSDMLAVLTPLTFAAVKLCLRL